MNSVLFAHSHLTLSLTHVYRNFIVEKAAKSFGLSADEKSINENDTFSLNCSAAANIFNKIKWMKEGKDFMEKTPRIKITNIDAKNYLRISVITFERVELNDAGTYTCIGFERRGGIEKAQHNLTVLGIYSVDCRIICLVFSMYIRFHNSFFKVIISKVCC